MSLFEEVLGAFVFVDMPRVLNFRRLFKLCSSSRVLHALQLGNLSILVFSAATSGSSAFTWLISIKRIDDLHLYRVTFSKNKNSFSRLANDSIMCILSLTCTIDFYYYQLSRLPLIVFLFVCSSILGLLHGGACNCLLLVIACLVGRRPTFLSHIVSSKSVPRIVECFYLNSLAYHNSVMTFMDLL